jgi:hypothetical protein
MAATASAESRCGWSTSPTARTSAAWQLLVSHPTMISPGRAEVTLATAGDALIS